MIKGITGDYAIDSEAVPAGVCNRVRHGMRRSQRRAHKFGRKFQKVWPPHQKKYDL